MVLGESGEAKARQKHSPKMTDLKDAKGTEEDLPKWFVPVWHELRKAFLIGAFTAGLVVAVMNWYRETFPAKDPATAESAAETREIMLFAYLRDNASAYPELTTYAGSAPRIDAGNSRNVGGVSFRRARSQGTYRE